VSIALTVILVKAFFTARSWAIVPIFRDLASGGRILIPAFAGGRLMWARQTPSLGVDYGQAHSLFYFKGAGINLRLTSLLGRI
jgi:hypothetical protein